MATCVPARAESLSGHRRVTGVFTALDLTVVQRMARLSQFALTSVDHSGVWW